MAFHHSPRTVSRGVVFNFDPINKKCYAGSGTEATSSIGSATGTLTNGITYDGKALVFDGTDEQVQFDDYLNSTFTSNVFTVSIWHNPSNVSANYNYIFTNGYPIQITLQTNQIAYWGASANSGTYFVNSFKAGSSLSTGNWYNHVLVNRGSNDREWYINGVSDGTNTANGTPATSNHAAGGVRIGDWAGNGYDYNGQISQITVYNQAHTAAEVLQNYNAMKVRYE